MGARPVATRRGLRTAAAVVVGLLVFVGGLAPAVATPVPHQGASASRSESGHFHPRGTVPMLGWLRSHGSPAAPTASSGDLAYGGGINGVGVLSGPPRVYLVFWGSQWGSQGSNGQGDATFTGDKKHMAPDLEAFFKGLGTGGESWSGVMTQYCQGIAQGAQTCTSSVPHIGYPTGGAFAGLWEDTSSAAPVRASPYQIGLEAVRAAGHFGNTTPTANRYAQYVVVSPTGTDPDGYKQGGFCAWHDYTGDGGIPSAYGDLAFTNLPYVPDAGPACGQDFVNANGTLDGVTIVEGHEYAETLTDQYPPGGWTIAGREVGDVCAWISSGQGAATDLSLTTGSFAVQSIWSNEFNGGSGGCVVSHTIDTGTNSAPDAPAEIWAIPGNGSATVGWTGPLSDGGTAILGYVVTATDTTTPANGGQTCSWTSGPLSCTMTGLTNGDDYSFTATARNALGSGPSSTPSSPIAPANVPDAPSGVHSTPGNGWARVIWTPGSDGGSPVTQYTVTASPGGQACTGGSTSCVVAGLRPAMAYAFTVVAWNEIGPSPASAASSPIYPFHPKGLGVETATAVLSLGVPFSAVVGGASSGAQVRLSLPGAASAACTANASGQCTARMRETRIGAFALRASVGALAASLDLYVPVVTAPHAVKRGAMATIAVSHCPRGASVVIGLSDGRRIGTRASSTGAATFHVKIPSVTKDTVSATVDGTLLARTVVMAVT